MLGKKQAKIHYYKHGGSDHPRQNEMASLWNNSVTGQLNGGNLKALAYEATYVRDGVLSGVTQ